jgi:choline dehydrogenase-like flavoprotein
MSDANVVIVGSGPAGVSAAWPLLNAGLRVHMIDPGVSREDATALDGRDFVERRFGDSEQWRVFLGSDASILENASPKLQAPEYSHVFRDFRDRYRIVADAFAAHGSLAPGGLSNAWGTGVGAFTDRELREYPFRRADLLPSYNAVATRIGVSGSADDELSEWYGNDYPLQTPHPVEPNFEPIYARHNRRVQRFGRGAPGSFRMGRPQHAVLTEDLGERSRCDLRGMCMFGCQRRAIYNAADELTALRAQSGFTYSSGWFVTNVVAEDGRFAARAVGMRDGGERSFRGDRVFLAAGTLGSTKLALEMLGAYDVDVPLLTTPILAFALCSVASLFAPPVERGYALSQLAFALELVEIDGAPEIFGGLFPTSGMLPTELYGRIPLLRPFGRRIGAWIWPRMLATLCFFPGTYSRNTLRLRTGGELAVHGGYADSLRIAVRHAVRRLTEEFAKLGVRLLPGSTSLNRPGEEMHYAGTLPMRERPTRYETDREGRLAGIDSVHVVDGAVLTTLPAKSHTFTIMANADRIARIVAARTVGSA